VSVIAAAFIVVSGALYAFLFALGRLYASAIMTRLAWVAYALLVACTFVLARALELGGAWLWVIAAMLVGYFFAPQAIWHLSVGTHAGESASETQSPAT
jgi:hypothetical protein